MKRTKKIAKKSAAVKLPAKSKPCGCTGVEFAAKDVMDLDNSYQDILSLKLTAPKKGYVVLTGSGIAQVLSATGTPEGWLELSIGPVSNGSNNGNETAVELPGIPGGNVYIRQPFSLTSVFPVNAGINRFYLVGIQDPNPNQWSVMFPKLTALFVESRL